MVRSLLFSTLYPSAARPLHGVFVETRLRELLQRGGVQAQVVAPVPWFWSTDPRYGDYARMAATPRHEVRHGVEVHHVDDLPRLARELGIAIGIIATPAGAAQTVADQLVAAGIRSILNFAPAVITVPPGASLRKVDLALELQILSFYQQHAPADLEASPRA